MRVLVVEDEELLADTIASGLCEEAIAVDVAYDGASSLDKAWDENIDPFSNIVRVAMATLRRKLGPPPVIETVTGAGYRL